MKSLLNTIISPEKAFVGIREKNAVWVPLIILSLLALLTVWIQLPLIEKLTLEKLHESGQAGQMDTALSYMRISTYIGAVFAVAVMAFITGFLLILVNMLARGEGKYMQLVHVALLASLPGLIGGLVTAGLSLRSNSINEVLLSAGAFLPDKKGLLFTMANLINPFTIWSLVLLILGTSIVIKSSAGKVAPIILIGWLAIHTASGLLGG